MTHKLLTAVCALALVLSFSFSATAAVQNVKVGGDIEVKGIWQNNYDVTLDSDDQVVHDYLMTTTRLYVEASLTDNVSAMVRLLNDRDWDSDATGATDVELDLAYLTLSDMYGYPVSLTIGRQELLYGEGFLVGDGVRFDGGADTYQYGARKAFDAIKAVWNYDPHQIDLFVAKIAEGSNIAPGATQWIDRDGDGAVDAGEQTGPLNNDMDLYGINWNYDGGMYGLWDVGLFYFTRDVELSEGRTDITSLSVRGEASLPQVEVGTLVLKGEIVKQWGNLEPVFTATPDKEILNAWGGYVEAEYTFDNVYAPYLGLGYIYMSGDDDDTDDVETFQPMYEDEKYGEIAEVVYGGLDTSITNASIWKLSAGVNPTENTALDLTYYSLRADRVAIDDQNKYIGAEYDLSFTYNYSEDVSFGLMYALFVPGKFFAQGVDNVNLENAQELLGSVKVTF